MLTDWWFKTLFSVTKVYSLHNSGDRLWHSDSHASLHLPVRAAGLGVSVLCVWMPGAGLVPALVSGDS